MNACALYPVLCLFAGNYPGLYVSNGQVCGFPPIDHAFYSTLQNVVPTGDECLAPADAETGLKKFRIAAAILPKWRAANLAANQCAAGVVAVEFPEAGETGTHELLISVCGPAPDAASTAKVEALARLPGTSVDLISTFGPFAKPAGFGRIYWWYPGSWPAEATALLPCACRPRSDTAGNCKLSGVAAPFAAELPPGLWSGTSCKRKACGEFLGTVNVAGLNYSMPAACR